GVGVRGLAGLRGGCPRRVTRFPPRPALRGGRALTYVRARRVPTTPPNASRGSRMRHLSRCTVLAGGLLGWACQSNSTNLGSTLPPPQHLAYQLDPSGTPGQPAGILLVWDDVQSSSLGGYRIYSRGSTTGAYGLRGVTTSNTFHDNGVPHLQYYVTAADVNGAESDPSNVITVDERLQLPQPASLSSISLNQAIQLDWTDNAFLANPRRFKWYRVYSMPYDLDAGLCVTQIDSISLE